MLVLVLLGTAVNVPLGVWKEHTRKFPLSWFAAVPFIVMGRLLALELKEVAAQIAIAAAVAGYNDLRQVDCVAVSQCGREGTLYGTSSSYPTMYFVDFSKCN
ncbi:hypothetical protein Golob_013516 [Gossypium lobatum]|uniref:Uncharacterized protein n=1 Tax=Gossypium lobatum TaxID=34289 RepID=A0A7J8LPT9_9ROSI|nr:hypothetical protein [Gossypium lobatum]